MYMTIALLLLVLLLLALLRRRPSPVVSTPHPAPVSPPPPPQSLPLQTRHVSFSLLSTNTSYSLPISPPPSLLVQRRWSSPFHKRRSSAEAPDSPRPPQPDIACTSVDQFGRILPSSDVHPPKPSRRPSTPLRLSFTGKWRSPSASYTSTLIPPDQVDVRAASPPLTFATQSSLQRTRFVNPFTKHSRSRTLSPPSSAFTSPDTSSSNPSDLSPPSSPPRRRRTLVNKFKSIFKPIPPDPNSPIIHSKPIFTNINSRLRRKPVARTQPYGPPWNAPMPVPDFDLSQDSLQKHAQTMSPTLHSRKRSGHEYSRSEKTSTSPSQLSPCTFISELDEKLSLL